MTGTCQPYFRKRLCLMNKSKPWGVCLGVPGIRSGQCTHLPSLCTHRAQERGFVGTETQPCSAHQTKYPEAGCIHPEEGILSLMRTKVPSAVEGFWVLTGHITGMETVINSWSLSPLPLRPHHSALYKIPVSSWPGHTLAGSGPWKHFL